MRAKIQLDGDNATRPQKLHGEVEPVYLFLILITMSLINRFQESKQDLIGSSLFIRRETG